MSTATQPALTNETTLAMRDFFVNTMEFEFPVTKNVLACVGDKNYRPDPKARTAGELAWHTAQSHIWFLDGIADGSFNYDPAKDAMVPSDIVAWYDQEYRRVLLRIKSMKPEQLTTVVDFFGMKYPNLAYLNFAHSHLVHHRGQLAAYLRPSGSKCPSIYGGSADEPWQG